MIKKFGSFVLVMSVALMLVSNVWAAKIIVDGNVAFDSGGFEDVAVGADPTSDYANEYVWNPSDGSKVAVYGPASPGPAGDAPGANEGSNYLYFGGANNTSASLGAYFGLSSAATTNQTVSAEFAFQVGSETELLGSYDMNATFAFASAPTSSGAAWGNNPQTWFGFRALGPAKTNGMELISYGADPVDGTLAWRSVVDTAGNPMTVAYGAWLDIEMNYTVGASTYTITVDDVTSQPTGTLRDGTFGNSITGLQILTNASGARPADTYFYLDSVAADVPEPGTIALLLTGLFGLLVWKRR